jgi:hypothetical protein
VREKPSERINLIFDGPVPAEYIKGHCSKEVAIKGLMEWDDNIDLSTAEIRHIWAKWVRVSDDDPEVPDGCEFAFRTRNDERRGWFKVTEVTTEKQRTF